MSYTYSIVLTKNNIQNLGTGNNVFRYTFPSSQSFENTSTAITTTTMYYCWNNITQNYSNNSFVISFPNGGSYTNYTLTIPDGNYEYSDLQTLLETYMDENYLFLTDPLGVNHYYINFGVLTSQYAISLTLTTIPTTVPSGWYKPPQASWSLPTTEKSPLITISNNFSNIIGFPQGQYPSTNALATATTTFISSTTPNISPIQCLLFQCNLCFNPFSTSPSTIFSMTNGDALFGALIPNNIYMPQFNSISVGSYQYIEIRITDQDFNPVTLIDPNIVIMLQFIKTNVQQNA